MVQPLADQHDLSAAFNQLLNLSDPSLLEARLQLVQEELLAEQVQAVAGDPSQDGMHRPRRKLTIGGIKEGAQEGHQEDQPTPPEAFGEGLGIPGKERHRLDHGQVEQAALDPPVDGGGRTGIVVCLFQNFCLSLDGSSVCEQSDEVPIVNNSSGGTKRKPGFVSFAGSSEV
jgi:hypothetical protein